ncbi:MAG TPA: OmpH family outer membrane protein [Candidatus Coprenecus stercoravium]|uniref:OmpH family outer membrane protein n=1 Tax=Candidatus Coprenecus stercoravium TaxID=2840735 RepID=A0A9D2GN28_9BACT|nr:OmpH family outer membrane protein [Candidatus Coprenecus stercoravium]
MKKINLIINIILILAVAALYVLHFTGQGTSANEPKATGSSTSAPEGAVVYINLDSLVNQYDMYNDLRSEFQNKLSAIENDINKQGRALENDIKSFNEKMQRGLLTHSQAESISNDLGMRDQELRNMAQQKQMEMAEEESVLYNKVMDAIITYVDKYNSDGRFSLILSTTAATNSVLDGDPGLNITEDILKGLNEEYIKNRNKK